MSLDSQVQTAYGCIHLHYTVVLMRVKGFNYDIDSLNTEKPPNELSVAFQEIFKSPPRLTVVELLRNLIPALRPVVRTCPPAYYGHLLTCAHEDPV